MPAPLRPETFQASKSSNLIKTAISKVNNVNNPDSGAFSAHISSSLAVSARPTDTGIPTPISTPRPTPTDSNVSKPLIDKQSYRYVVLSGISGGVAGCAAKTLIAPLDRVKILFQTSNPEFRKYSGSFFGFYRAIRFIYRTDGPLGLFQGHSATILRIFPYAAIKFVAYEQIRNILIPSPDYETGVRRLLAGSLSGVASVFFTYPLDLIRVRMAFETKSNFSMSTNPSSTTHKHGAGGRLWQTCLRIYNEPPSSVASTTLSSSSSRSSIAFSSPHSPCPPANRLLAIRNFYSGFTPTIIGMIPYAGVSFWTHDLLHDIFRSPLLAPIAVHDYDKFHVNTDSDGKRLPLVAWAQLVAGGLAGMCSQTASYPLEVIRRRMQVSGAIVSLQLAKAATNTSKGAAKVIYPNMTQTMKTIYAERGLRGFFVGLSIGYIKVTPMVACSFYVYERMKSYLLIQ
ncbi:mitochondrial carrier [Nadsonia fulvescens var. elongata DSM 6958]|uniref:Mitochondrial carrier n=1 Tax=Nadsonia fulvescens var. elongata DSM 6958 TaxID=857566 RepID=A0A1E3PQA8_9ASCO|nr:mitochondrial carrier [Nadsonia fulvescens var. elongata DSM 6958]